MTGIGENLLDGWPVSYWAKAAAFYFQHNHILPPCNWRGALDIKEFWLLNRLYAPSPSPLVGIPDDVDFMYARRLFRDVTAEIFAA